ncbi:YbhN family protein [Streptomyces sp. NPDC058001]|uniref:lysylphosphatidylglycerol synthase transmembrane domain-containing protein n=1 Tax=Streptomyces sp. NPDC058001 TaxID=3346300 RepID=UPI0036F07635
MTQVSGASVDRRAYWRTALTLLVVGLAVVFAVRHRTVIGAGASQLAGGHQGWLLLAAVATLSTWVCASVVQQGAVAEPLPVGRLVATQFAASAANHVLPAGLGAGAVNLRFLMRCGLSLPRAATALGVKAVASAVSRATLIAVLALFWPAVLRPPAGFPLRSAVAVAALPVAGVIAALLLSDALRTRVRGLVCGIRSDIRTVHRLPARAAALWGGSFAFASLHALVVVAVSRAIGLPLPAAQVALVYFAASSAAVLLPTPGGIGSLDAALALALVVTGTPATLAASVVLGYRLLTVWLPLLPGLVTLVVLVRRRVL